MRLKEFNVKCLMVTFCIGILLYLFYPRYEFFDPKTRCDKINGTVETYGYHGWSKY